MANLDACEEGPLDERKCQLVWDRSSCTNLPVSSANHTGVVRAFDEAWELDKANCPKYNR